MIEIVRNEENVHSWPRTVATLDKVTIAQSDRDGGNENSRGEVRRAAKSGDYCAKKTTPPIKTFVLRVLQHPSRPEMPVRSILCYYRPSTQQKQQSWSVEEARKQSHTLKKEAKRNDVG